MSTPPDKVDALLSAMGILVERLNHPVTEPLVAIPVAEAARRLGCSRRQIFYHLKTGVLTRAPRLGRRLLIMADSIHRALTTGVPLNERAPIKRRVRYPKPKIVPVVKMSMKEWREEFPAAK